MINPNKSYKQSSLATIVSIDGPNTFCPHLVIQTADGTRYAGPLLRVYSQWKRLAVGQRVGFELQWSIVADAPMVSRLVVKRASNV